MYLELWAISWGLWCFLSLACAFTLTGWRLIRLSPFNAIAIACTRPFLGVEASSQDLLLNKRSTPERIVGGDMGVWLLACLVSWKGGGVCTNNSPGDLFQVNWGRENKLDNPLTQWRPAGGAPSDLLLKINRLFSGHGSELLELPGLCSTHPHFLHDLIATNGVDGQVMLIVVGTGRFPGSATIFRVSVWLGSRGA